MPAVTISDFSEMLADQIERRLELAPNAMLADDVGPELFKWDQAKKASADRGKFKRALSASAGVGIDLLNSASDKDSAGLFGATKDTKDLGISPMPRLHPGPGQAWLKYRFGAGLRAEASVALGLGALEGDAGRNIEYGSYRRHAGAERISAALLSDLASMPSALDYDDVVALAAGDAVSLRMGGRLALKFVLDEDAIASSNLRPLSGAFGIAGPLFLQFTSGFKFSAEVAFTDDLRLCFVGLGDGRTHVSVRKADSSALALGGGASFSVGFPQATQDLLLEQITGALFSATVDRVEAILSRLSPEQFLAGEPQLLQQLVARLGITAPISEHLVAVQKRLDGWKAKLKSTIVEVLKTRVEIGISYEYSRVATSGSLLEAEMDAQTLRELHPGLLAFDLRPSLDLATSEEAVAEPARRLKQFFYLHERRVTRISSRGFTLGIGKWLDISAKFVGQRTVIAQTDVRGYHRLSWISTHTVSGAFNEAESSSSLTFRAETDKFIESPRMGDLKFALGLESTQQALNTSHLPSYLDLAALWGVIPLASIDAQFLRIKSIIPSTSEFNTVISVQISDRLVRAVATWLKTHDNAGCCGLLARSLPFWKHYEGRSNPLVRERTYEPVFRKFLFEEGSLNFYPERLVRNALAQSHPLLSRAEAAPNRPQQLAFAGFATQADDIGHHAIGMRLDTMRQALSQLLIAPLHSANEMNQVLDIIYGRQKTFAERSFLVRFFGALLAEVARASGYPDGWVASITFTYDDAAGVSKTLAIAGTE